MKKFVAMLMAVLMVLSMAACGGSSAPAETKAPAAADAAPAATEAPAAEGAAPALKIGLTGPMTGPASAYGLAVRGGMEIAVAEINAKGGRRGRRLRQGCFRLQLPEGLGYADHGRPCHHRLLSRHCR